MEEAKLELLKICKSNTSTKNGQIPILLLANKQDLPSALDECKIEAALGLKKELGNSFQWHLQPICAVTGEGLDEGMEMLHTMITQRRKLRKSHWDEFRFPEMIYGVPKPASSQFYLSPAPIHEIVYFRLMLKSIKQT